MCVKLELSSFIDRILFPWTQLAPPPFAFRHCQRNSDHFSARRISVNQPKICGINSKNHLFSTQFCHCRCRCHFNFFKQNELSIAGLRFNHISLFFFAFSLFSSLFKYLLCSFATCGCGNRHKKGHGVTISSFENQNKMKLYIFNFWVAAAVLYLCCCLLFSTIVRSFGWFGEAKQDNDSVQLKTIVQIRRMLNRAANETSNFEAIAFSNGNFPFAITLLYIGCYCCCCFCFCCCSAAVLAW